VTIRQRPLQTALQVGALALGELFLVLGVLAWTGSAAAALVAAVAGAAVFSVPVRHALATRVFADADGVEVVNGAKRVELAWGSVHGFELTDGDGPLRAELQTRGGDRVPLEAIAGSYLQHTDAQRRFAQQAIAALEAERRSAGKKRARRGV
jgi:hypothetical protein